MKKIRVLNLSLLLLLICFMFCFVACDKTQGEGFLKAEGKDIVFSSTGEKFIPHGVNAGGLLVREGWLCPVRGGEPEGMDYYDKLMLKTSQKRLGREKTYQIEKSYIDNWWTEADFDNVKNLGFNHIRLNFSYMNFYYLNEDGSLQYFREDAFSYIDWFISNCEMRGLYVVLDMHGAFGSQNGKQHSGDTEGFELFSNEDNMKKTEELWGKIAKRYKDNKTIFAYDLLNEPEGDPAKTEGKTTELQWEFYDRLYKAIRKVDKNHIIMMESCWETSDLPAPSKYNWKNVVYQLHIYNWDCRDKSKTAEAAAFWSFKELSFKVAQKGEDIAPIYVGEWNGLGDKKEWQKGLNLFKKYDIGWCMWSYKGKGKNSNWTLYNGCEEEDILDFEKDSFEVLLEKSRRLRTETDNRFMFNEYLYNILKSYL